VAARYGGEVRLGRGASGAARGGKGGAVANLGRGTPEARDVRAPWGQPWRTCVRVLREHRRREVESEREWRGALVLLGLAKHKRRRGRAATQWGRGSRAVATRKTRVVHCGIQPNRW
jgi:hypothetical protein